MSENEKQPPTPSKQTSSVPLKKETVRVTLKAADAPAVPSSTVPAAPAVRPPTPGAPPAPTPPPAPTAAPRPAPAPTIPLRTAGPAGAAPAPTIRLATSTAPIGAPGAPTKPLGTATKPLGATPTLPKATVQLQAPTTSLPAVSPSQAPTLQAEEEEEEAVANEGVVNILAGVGLAAALVVLVFQLMLANTWISVEDAPKPGEWSQLFE